MICGFLTEFLEVVSLLGGSPIIAAHTFTFRMGEVTQMAAQINYKLLTHLQYSSSRHN
jgi:hypothetical protein